MSANLGLMGVFHSLSFNKIPYISSEIWGSKGKIKKSKVLPNFSNGPVLPHSENLEYFIRNFKIN